MRRPAHPDRGSDERASEPPGDLDREPVPVFGVHEDRQVRPVLLHRPRRDDDGRDPGLDRRPDLGRGHPFHSYFGRHGWRSGSLGLGGGRLRSRSLSQAEDPPTRAGALPSRSPFPSDTTRRQRPIRVFSHAFARSVKRQGTASGPIDIGEEDHVSAATESVERR